MGWLKQLPVDRRSGSRPRCVLLMEGSKVDVADRLTDLVGLPNEVVITCKDLWRPFGKADVREAQLDDKNTSLLLCSHRKKLRDWWLVKGKSMQSWDIASTCTIKGKKGLLLVEAKAHRNEEMSKSDKSGSTDSDNRKQIASAIAEAATGLRSITGGPWTISRDHHYQLSNRFAWSWKLATMNIPVVLLYLGFLGAEDMAKKGRKIFHSGDEWEDTLKRHCKHIVDNSCWGKWLDVNGVPLLPLIRSYDQPFEPCED